MNVVRVRRFIDDDDDDDYSNCHRECFKFRQTNMDTDIQCAD